MTAVKNLALSVCVLASSSTCVQAGPMSRSGSPSRWITWVSNRTTTNNGGYTISGPPILNIFNADQAPSPKVAANPPAATSRGNLTLVASDAPPATPAPFVAAAASTTAYTPPISNYAAAPASFSAANLPVARADAYIDLNDGPYPNAGILTSGGAQPWYNSPTAIQAYGGVPNAEQQASFGQAVLSRVQQTFQLSGLNPTITIDPDVPARHTMSVVSNTANASDPDAIGMTEVGGSGFGYLDKLASLKLNSDQLAWAVAHNVSHELMHSFGVGSHPDQSGSYLDSASATVSVLTDPNTTFSPAAVQLMKSTDFGMSVTGSSFGAEKLSADPNHVGAKCHCVFCHGIYGHDGLGGHADAQSLEAPVPEPSTILVWGVSLAAAGFVYRRNRAA